MWYQRAFDVQDRCGTSRPVVAVGRPCPSSFHIPLFQRPGWTGRSEALTAEEGYEGAGEEENLFPPKQRDFGIDPMHHETGFLRGDDGVREKGESWTESAGGSAWSLVLMCQTHRTHTNSF